MTPAQRTKKLEQASGHARSAVRYLTAAVDDMSAESFTLTAEQMGEWSAAVRALSSLNKALENLPNP